ncbi:BatA domain-containing protein [Fontivita pretiosa]|uniref:BatA domain-containing protein n=1 Tax=Fontivita pretiosa TaxID=2989684 RepID=UPI003D17EBE4
MTTAVVARRPGVIQLANDHWPLTTSMYFASPLWLLGLIAWAGVALWLLTGKRQRQAVPFVDLWRGPLSSPRARAAMHVPPSPVILLLLATVVAILAAGQPHLRTGAANTAVSLTIIVDRGLTMSARGQSRPRWQELLIATRDPILQHFGRGPVRLLLVPDTTPVESDRARWADVALAAESSSRDTRDLLPQVLRRELRFAAGPVIVLSDLPLDLNDDRLVQIAPETSASNVGIVMVSANATASAGSRYPPAAQIMARVRNDSSFSQATLRVLGEGISVTQPITLPPAGQEENYFIDVPDAAKIEIAIDTPTPDSQPIDNHATLWRTRSWPIVQGSGELPPEVLRMIQVYQRVRPAGEGSTRVAVSADSVDGPAVIVGGDGQSLGAWPEVRVEDHPVTRDVDWPAALAGASVARLPGEAGWHPLVMAGERAVIAVRQTPARQVWIGLSSDRWPRSTDFVVFWTNALDWAGQGQELYRAEHVPAVPMPREIQTNWRGRLASLAAASATGIELSPGLLITAMLLVLLAVSVRAWQGRRAMGAAGSVI